MVKQTSEAVILTTDGELRCLAAGYRESTSTLVKVNSQPEGSGTFIHFQKRENKAKQNPDESRGNLTGSIRKKRFNNET